MRNYHRAILQRTIRKSEIKMTPTEYQQLAKETKELNSQDMDEYSKQYSFSFCNNSWRYYFRLNKKPAGHSKYYKRKPEGYIEYNIISDDGFVEITKKEYDDAHAIGLSNAWY